MQSVRRGNKTIPHRVRPDLVPNIRPAIPGDSHHPNIGPPATLVIVEDGEKFLGPELTSLHTAEQARDDTSSETIDQRHAHRGRPPSVASIRTRPIPHPRWIRLDAEIALPLSGWRAVPTNQALWASPKAD